MYHYVFTNDLRISKLEVALYDAGKCFFDDTVPTAYDNKNANNNMNTLGFYFNLTNNSFCTRECVDNNVRNVVLNFIKKFQYPNPRTKESLENSLNDHITIAPMRVIVQILYMMNMEHIDNAFLNIEEIENFIFFNEQIAKSEEKHFLRTIEQIIQYRIDKILPENIETDESKKIWNQYKRQIREMVKILLWSGCIKEDNLGNIYLDEVDLSDANKIDLFDIITYKNFWKYDNSKNFEENKLCYQEYMDIVPKTFNSITSSNNNVEDSIGYNKIFYGIPGCGKSYYIEHTILENVDKEHNVFRTTFFLDYSNSDFIGQILPKVENGNVTYEPIPGPFTQALERALTVENEMVYLVIEEINRGNAAAIFGDIFQLLDRLKKDYDNRVVGDSEYPITNEFIETYFQKRIKEGAKINYTKGKIFIPHNLTILATMNTSDQNVFPLDTAFKRRWDKKRIVPNWDDVEFKDLYIPFTKYTWENFVKQINKKMLDESIDGMIMEDKQIGPYFISEDLLATKDEKNDVAKNKDKLERFVNNVIDYIYSDVSKFDRENWFDPNVSFDDIYNAICKYETIGDTKEERFIGKDNFCLKLNNSKNNNVQDTNKEGKDEE